MNSKQRVHAALKKQPVDRVPIFMWYHQITAKQLGELLEILPSRVSEVMGDDIKQTWVANNHAMEGIVHEHKGEGHIDDWGLEWVKNDEFNQIVHSPLENASKEEILNYQFRINKGVEISNLTLISYEFFLRNKFLNNINKYIYFN